MRSESFARVMAFSWLPWGLQLDWVIFGDFVGKAVVAPSFHYLICAINALPILIAELLWTTRSGRAQQ